MDTLFINGRGLSEFKGELFYYWQTQPAAASAELYRGRNRTTMRELSVEVGTKTLSFSIVFYGKDRNEALANSSAFNAETLGLCELYMPDDLYYSGTFTKRSMKTFVGGIGVEISYTFDGIAHGSLITVSGTNIVCLSNVPQTDCRLTATVGTAASTYTIMLNDLSIVFGNSLYAPETDDVLVWDGITGRVMVNGAPAAHWASFLRLPYLLKGSNTITAPDAVTVEYYPTFL